MGDTKLRSVRLPLELDQALRARAEVEDRSVSWLIVRAVEQALGEQATSRESPEARGVPGASGARAQAPAELPSRTEVRVEPDLKRSPPQIPGLRRASS